MGYQLTLGPYLDYHTTKLYRYFDLTVTLVLSTRINLNLLGGVICLYIHVYISIWILIYVLLSTIHTYTYIYIYIYIDIYISMYISILGWVAGVAREWDYFRCGCNGLVETIGYFLDFNIMFSSSQWPLFIFFLF